MSNEKSVSFMPTALTYGVLGGLAIVVFNLVNYITLFSTSSIGGAVAAFALTLAVWFGMVALAIRKHRDKDLGGYITMGKALGLGIVTVMIASLLSGIFGYIYMTMIDPELLAKQTASMSWMYEIMGMDEDQIDEITGTVEDMQQQPSLITALGGALMGGAFTGLIVSAITGAIMRKNPPEEFNQA